MFDTDAPTPVQIVHDRAEFDAAVETMLATGGEIRIATDAAPFRIHLWDVDPAAKITVTSEDPANMSHVERAVVYYSSNFEFTDLHFDPIPTSGIKQDRHHNFVSVYSEDITLRDNVFDGGASGMLAVDQPDEANRGVMIRDSSTVTLESNTFTGLLHALTLKNSDTIEVRDNDFTQLQADAIQLAGSQDVMIESNAMHDMLGVANNHWHADMIQFWGDSVNEPNQNITIRDNYMNSGDAVYQGIYGFNGQRDTIQFSGMTIENNLIVTGSTNGIYISDFDDVTIRNNTVLSNREANLLLSDGSVNPTDMTRIFVQNTANSVIENNIGKVNPPAEGDEGDLTITNNHEVDYVNPDAPYHVDKVFVNAGHAGANDARDFQQIDTSPLADMGASLPETLAQAMMTAPDCVIAGVQTADLGTQQMQFSVHQPDPGLTYVWTFDDGQTATGPQVTRFFRDAGPVSVTLEAISDGQVIEAVTRQQTVSDARLIDLDFSGTDTATDAAGASIHGLDPAHVVENPDGPDGTATSVYVSTGDNPFEFGRDNAFLQCLDEFSMSMDLRRTDVAQGGAIMALPFGMELYLNDDGALRITLATTDTPRAFHTVGENLMNDTDWHSLSVRYSNDLGMFSVRLDDAEIFSTAATGTIVYDSRPMQVFSRFNLPGLQAEAANIRMVDYYTETDAGIDDVDGYLDALMPAPAPDPADGIRAVALADVFAVEDDSFWFTTGFEEDGQTTGSAQLMLSGNRTVSFADRGVTGQGLDLTGQGSEGLTTDRGVDGVHGLDAFTLGLSVKIDPASASGDLVYLPDAMRLRYVEGQGVEFQLDTESAADGRPGISNGRIFETQALDDGAFHRIVASYDGAQGQVTLYLDGAELGRMDAVGSTAPGTYWGMAIGSHWTASATAVLDDFVFADQAVGALAVAEDHAAFLEDMGGGAAALPGVPALSLEDVFAENGAFYIVSDFDGTTMADGSVQIDLDASSKTFAFTDDGVTGQALQLRGQANDGLEIDRSVSEIHEMDEFTVAASVRIDDESDSGDLLYLPNAFRLRYLDGDGIRMELDAGDAVDDFKPNVETGVTISTPVFEDGAYHRVVMTYDSTAGLLRLFVDGAELGSMDATGMTATQKYWGLSIGSKWTDSATAELDDFLFANQAVDDQQVLADHEAFLDALDAYDDAQLADLEAHEAQIDDLMGSGA